MAGSRVVLSLQELPVLAKLPEPESFSFSDAVIMAKYNYSCTYSAGGPANGVVCSGPAGAGGTGATVGAGAAGPTVLELMS